MKHEDVVGDAMPIELVQRWRIFQSFYLNMRCSW